MDDIGPGSPTQPKPLTKHPKELSAEQRLRLDQVNLKSLSLCIGMLERIDSVSRCLATFNFLPIRLSSHLDS